MKIMGTASIRQEALRALIKNKFDGVARRLALAAKKPEGQINDMLSDPPRKPFGEKIARQLEIRLGLSDGYFDQPIAEDKDSNEPLCVKESAAVWGFETPSMQEVAKIMLELDADHQKKLVSYANHLLNEQRTANQNSIKRAG